MLNKNCCKLSSDRLQRVIRDQELCKDSIINRGSTLRPEIFDKMYCTDLKKCKLANK